MKPNRKSYRALWVMGAGLAVLFSAATWSTAATDKQGRDSGGTLLARIIARGIPGAGAVAEVGDFPRGSPMHDNAALSPFAKPGQVLGAKRILVASTSNFGAPLARKFEPEGSVISIDPASGPIDIPSDFAQAGGQASACTDSPGAAVFNTIGCAACHTPSLPGPGSRQAVQLYSDLLLHDMGAAFDDHIKQGTAIGSEWRTMPLWRVSERTKFLHDGRALSLTDAITAHGGQAQQSRNAFFNIDATSRQAILSFLGCL